MIVVKDLHKTFPGTGTDPGFRAVDHISFEVPEGSFFTLLGPSGCGKTTTLRCIAGLERPDSGEVTLGDTVVVSDKVYVSGDRRDVGMVFQSYAVWPHLSVFDNAAFPLTVGRTRLRPAEVRERVLRTLDMVGLDGLADRKPTQLSGGQQQRLSLARALVHQPRCLLFDEPLSNLDAKLRERMRAELRDIQRALGFTALYVTHDQIEALSLSDGIAVMHRGRIVQQGTPEEIYFRPTSRRVAEFIGASNIVPGAVVADGDGAVLVRTPLGDLRCTVTAHRPAVGSTVLVSLRPEDVRLARPGDDEADDGQEADGTSGSTPEPDGTTVSTASVASNLFRAVVRRSTFGGAATELSMDVGAGLPPLRVQAASRDTVAVGDTVTLTVRPEHCHLLPDDEPQAVHVPSGDGAPRADRGAEEVA